MECPFELPVKKELLPRNTKNIDLYRIGGSYFPYTKAEADYIVQAINSHEKFKTALEVISDLETHRLKTGIGYDKVTHELVKDALKEVEKK